MSHRYYYCCSQSFVLPLNSWVRMYSSCSLAEIRWATLVEPLFKPELAPKEPKEAPTQSAQGRLRLAQSQLRLRQQHLRFNARLGTHRFSTGTIDYKIKSYSGKMAALLVVVTVIFGGVLARLHLNAGCFT